MRCRDDVSDMSDRVDIHLLSSELWEESTALCKGSVAPNSPHWMGDHAVDTVRPAEQKRGCRLD